MGPNVTARRLLVLVCLFFAVVPLQLASGQEALQEGLQEGGVDVDDPAVATGLSEVRVHVLTTLLPCSARVWTFGTTLRCVRAVGR